MNKRFEEIERRKQELLKQAARERDEVAAACERLRSAFDLTGTVSGICRALKARPMIIAGVSSLLVSSLAGKLFRGARQLTRIARVALPIWAWWRLRRKIS